MNSVRIDRVSLELGADLEVTASAKSSHFVWVYLGGAMDGELALHAAPDAWPAIYRRLGEALRSVGVELNDTEPS